MIKRLKNENSPKITLKGHKRNFFIENHKKNKEKILVIKKTIVYLHRQHKTNRPG
jgi:hypothetical protein